MDGSRYVRGLLEVHFHDPHLYFISRGQHGLQIFDAVIRHARNVHQPIHTFRNVHEGAPAEHRAHGALDVTFSHDSKTLIVGFSEDKTVFYDAK